MLRRTHRFACKARESSFHGTKAARPPREGRREGGKEGGRRQCGPLKNSFLRILFFFSRGDNFGVKEKEENDLWLLRRATPSASPPARPSDSDASVRDRPCPQNANISPSFPSLSLLSSYSSLSCCARNCDCDAQIHLSARRPIRICVGQAPLAMQKLACRTSEENGVALHPRGGEGGGENAMRRE